ncbi:hypothetical protein [Erwinia tasmaniensis]|nr:hypothetical protein [Erwinia tasmaniensis]
MFLKIILSSSIILPACMMTNAAAVAPELSYKAPEPSLSSAPLTDPLDHNPLKSSPSLQWKTSEPKAKVRLTPGCDTLGCRYHQNNRNSISHGALPKTHLLRQNDPFSADHGGEEYNVGVTFDFTDDNN